MAKNYNAYRKIVEDYRSKKMLFAYMNKLITQLRANPHIKSYLDIPLEHVWEISRGVGWAPHDDGKILINREITGSPLDDWGPPEQHVAYDGVKYYIPYSYFHAYKIGNDQLLLAMIKHTKDRVVSNLIMELERI